MTGSKFEKAAEKYTEALALLPAVPNMTPKDSLALYNNRSAMLEKCGQYDKALEDISVVLSMDRFHVKALTRRGRIYENQQKPREALHDYVLATLLEQTQGRAPDCAPRIDDLAKQIAVAHAQEAVVTLGTSPARDLPGQSYCRSFFETFQSYHEGKEASKSWDRASLERQLSNAADASHAHLALTLAQLLIARDEYSAALAVVDEALEFFCRTQMKHAVVHHGGEVSADKLWSFMEQNLSMMMDVTSLLQSETDHEHHHHDHHHHPAPHHHSQSHSLRSALAQLIDMRANGLHLRCDFTGARRGYDLSIAMDGGHCVEPLLKLASIKVELGDAGKV